MKDLEKNNQKPKVPPAAEALSASKKQFERMANTLPVMIYDSVLSPDGTSRFLYVAPEPCRKLLELDPEALLKDMSLIWNIVHPDDLARFYREDVAANRAGTEFTSEVRIITPSGRRKWLLVNSKPNPASPGEAVVWSGYLQDITARKQAQERVREAEQKLRLLVEHSTNLFYMHTPDHVLTYVSPQSRQFFDCEPEEAMVKWTELITDHPANAEAILLTQRAIDTGQRQAPYQLQCIGKKGRKIWVEVNEAPVVENGVTVAISGTLTDITRRKQAQMEREQFHTFFRASADLMCIADANGKFRKINPAFAKTLGYSERELTSQSFLEFIHPDDRQPTLDEIARQQQTGFTDNFENRYICKDGSVKWLSWRVTYDSKDNVAYGTAHDITEQKMAEENLRASRNLLHTVLENIPICVFWKDADLKYRGCNTAFALSAGFLSPEDLLGKDDFQMCWQEQAEFYRADDRRVMTSEQPEFGIEKQQATPDGSTIWVRTSKVPLYDSERNVVGLLGIDEDFTERRKADEALRESEFFFKESQRLASIGSYKADLLADYWNSSEVLDEIFGIDADYDRSIQGWLALVHPDDRPMMERYLREEVIAQRKPFAKEYRIIRFSDGETRWISGRGAIKSDDDGQLLLMMGTIQDITEQKRREADKAKVEAQLHQSQKIESVGRLAGGVAHDYNNMLSVIIGYTELAKMKVAPADPLQEDLEQILTAAKRSRDITRQLLAFARKQTIDPKVLDLNASVGNTLKMLQQLLGENINLLWSPAEELWPVEIDPSQLEQVLTNLCINARDAIADVGKMTIATGKTSFDQSDCDDHPGLTPGDYVMLEVSDNGCGIENSLLDKIFEPFFTTKPVGVGTGLGLATVYGIVKQGQGFINVYSDPGWGTTFKIYLPRYKGPVGISEEEAMSGMALSGHGETILVVEDEISILKLTEAILSELGYKVLTANRPGEALTLAKRHSGGINLLLTDVVMPEMNGRELAGRLQQLYPQLKCLYMSGYTANAIAHHGVLDKDIQFIHKPFSRIELSQHIKKVLGEGLPPS